MNNYRYYMLSTWLLLILSNTTKFEWFTYIFCFLGVLCACIAIYYNRAKGEF